jgi:ABC-type sugar transport system permease subunit
VRRRRTLSEIFRDEKKFWRLFRLLLAPCSVAAFLICIVSGIAAATGEQTVYSGTEAVLGWKGFAASVIYFPIIALAFALMFAWGLYFDRTVWPALKHRISRLSGRT